MLSACCGLPAATKHLTSDALIRGVIECCSLPAGGTILPVSKYRLRFNTFIRLFFAEIVVEVDRPGMGWRKGKKKGELPECNARINKFTLDPEFETFINQFGIELPDGLKAADSSYWKRSESQGSPRM